jgi:hypothetical protein
MKKNLDYESVPKMGPFGEETKIKNTRYSHFKGTVARNFMDPFFISLLDKGHRF